MIEYKGSSNPHHIPTDEEWGILFKATELLDKWVAEGKPWSYNINYKIP